ncbi:hypothetical protein BJX99DRAFT_168172 [Aspergillus californicus]
MTRDEWLPECLASRLISVIEDRAPCLESLTFVHVPAPFRRTQPQSRSPFAPFGWSTASAPDYGADELTRAGRGRTTEYGVSPKGELSKRKDSLRFAPGDTDNLSTPRMALLPTSISNCAKKILLGKTYVAQAEMPRSISLSHRNRVINCAPCTSGFVIRCPGAVKC